MFLFLTGAGLLSAIVGLFWLKDRLQSPLLARIAYSGLIAHLAGARRRLVSAGAFADTG